MNYIATKKTSLFDQVETFFTDLLADVNDDRQTRVEAAEHLAELKANGQVTENDKVPPPRYDFAEQVKLAGALTSFLAMKHRVAPDKPGKSPLERMVGDLTNGNRGGGAGRGRGKAKEAEAGTDE